MRTREVGTRVGRTDDDSAPAPELSERAELPVREAKATLLSGRRYRIGPGDDGADRLVVSAPDGEIVLAIEVTDRGPVLRLRSAVLEVSATHLLRLAGSEVHLESSGDLHIETGKSLRQRIGCHHHLRVAGDQRVEASALEMQANRGHVQVRAMERISLDGEHIGLNDDPAPSPFPWSAISDTESKA